MRQPLHGIRGAAYDAVCAIVQRFGRPGLNSGLIGSGINRWFLRLGPLTLALSQYQTDKPMRPTSGDRQAIDESLWLFTRKTARGIGIVRSWAALMNIDIEISGQRFSSENGVIDLHPPIAPLYQSITVHNTGSQAEASVDLTVYFDETRPHAGAFGQVGAPTDYYVPHRLPCARVQVDRLKPGTSVKAPVELCVTVGRIAYRTIPQHERSLARIYGRPEWETL